MKQTHKYNLYNNANTPTHWATKIVWIVQSFWHKFDFHQRADEIGEKASGTEANNEPRKKESAKYSER